MNLNEYQKKAEETAIYGEDKKILYPSVGLVGESGEVCDKIKKVMRDSNWVATDDDRKHIALELGDVFWYAAIIMRDLGMKLSVIEKSIMTIKETGAVDYYKNMRPESLAISLGVQCTTAAEIAVNNGNKCFVAVCVAHIVTIINVLAQKYGYTLADVAQMNVDKLASRFKRDAIKGSGDDR